METPLGRWVLAVFLALALVGLLAYARGEPGDDGRAPDPESASTVELAAPAGTGTSAG
jgi:hypothetical protein